MSYVVRHSVTGKFLARAEAHRHGCRAKLKPWPYEWTDLDHALRFDTAEAAVQAAPPVIESLVLPLDQAWALT